MPTTLIPDTALPPPTGHDATGTPFWQVKDGETLTPTAEGVVLADGKYPDFLEKDVDELEQSALAVIAAIRQHRRIIGQQPTPSAVDASWPDVSSPSRAAELAGRERATRLGLPAPAPALHGQAG
jgi:hypothetical protein